MLKFTTIAKRLKLELKKFEKATLKHALRFYIIYIYIYIYSTLSYVN